jgi:hypothetical protein
MGKRFRLVVASIALAGLLATATLPTTAEAESAWFVIVDGPLLDRRVIVDNRSGDSLHFADVKASLAVTLDDLRGRPYLDLALIFGPPSVWEDYAGDAESLSRIRPEQGQPLQIGRFYPGVGDSRPALFLIWDVVPRPSRPDLHVSHASPSQLDMLTRAGVPVHVEEPVAQSATDQPVMWLLAIGALAVAFMARGVTRVRA